jgi:RNA recognition motif-containing protein
VLRATRIRNWHHYNDIVCFVIDVIYVCLRISNTLFLYYQDYYTKEPKGFAFVEFMDRRDAEDAMYDLRGKEIDGNRIAIVIARDQRKTPAEMKPRDNHRGRDNDDRRDNRRDNNRRDNDYRDNNRDNNNYNRRDSRHSTDRDYPRADREDRNMDRDEA